jgi:Xaa-Pro aminopeptidase
MFSDCVLVDAGCDVNGYVSDITRCFPVSGTWTKPQEELYEALRVVHEELLSFANSLKKVSSMCDARFSFDFVR